ncbi:Armadillo repeat-containing protein 5 [Eumeta japonica]|uniref:Armadillo repeat-containing protein 5 n=1 Tax=Eumeta variegata TaxID=151549 RepID=A0A4C1Y3C9_EUMVA|nr:Armadillo repeat-containing protein 5 [Eumeta japonica]
MDPIYVKALVEGLKSTSSKHLLEILIKIRNKVAVNDQGIQLFREYNGFDYLVPLLRKPNEKLLDVTLSILGNCCLEELSGLVVHRLNIYGALVTLLNTLSKDSILGRTCRLIGNLAQQNCNAESLHNHGAIVALVNIIENRDKKTSYPTLTMAVRAIRQLWMFPDKREEMLACKAIYCIAMLMINECESAGIIKSTNTCKESDGFRKSQEELINGILKCLGYFTTYSTTQCSEQIQGDGRGYQSLIALTKLYETTALKCLMNLCYVSSCRPLLGTAGFVECFISILQKTSDASWWPEGATRALALLSGESVNRSRLRHCGGLALLVAAARVSPDALQALLQYIFDDISFQILVNEGLISLLTDELTNYVSTMELEHNEIKTKNVVLISKDSDLNEKNETKDSNINVDVLPKENLLKRRKQSLPQLTNEDELKVVIERDNMLVGFVDSVESDASDESQSDDENRNKRGVKRNRSTTPNPKKKIKMVHKDWSAGVYWEPKSPEWPNQSPHQASRSMMSTDRANMSPLSLYSEGNQSGFSPEYSFLGSSRRTRWDWSPESGFSTGEGSAASPHWTEYQWSPSSSGSPTSPYSGVDESSDSEMSGRYSPVCSEVEDEGSIGVTAENRVSNAELVAAQVTHDLHELIMDDDESIDGDLHLDDDASKLELNTKSGRIACVLVLLYRVSHGANSAYTTREESVVNHTIELLTGHECLNALLDYVERCKRPLGRVSRILAKVLSNALCLISILKHRLVLRLHSMSVNSKHQITKCLQCKQQQLIVVRHAASSDKRESRPAVAYDAQPRAVIELAPKLEIIHRGVRARGRIRVRHEAPRPDGHVRACSLAKH